MKNGVTGNADPLITKTEMNTQFYRVQWNGYTVEVNAYVDHDDVELDSLTFEDENGNQPNELELLGSLTPSRGNAVKNPIEEIEDLVRTADAEKRQEIADGTWFSSCD